MTPFAKAPLALLARTDLTATEKLITIVRADLERRGLPTTAVAVAKAAGLDERTVRRIEARKPDRLSGRQPDKMSGKTGQLVRSETGQNVRPAIDVIKPLRDRGRERDFPPLVAGATQSQTATDTTDDLCATSRASIGPGARLAALARPAGRWTDEAWEAQVAEDLRHGRYTPAALEQYLATVGLIATAPWKLAADVVAAGKAGRARAWRERLAAIRAGGLVLATHRDGTRARVRFVDAEAGYLVLVRPPPRGYAGRGPAPLRIDDPAALAEWKLERKHPTLFPVEA